MRSYENPVLVSYSFGLIDYGSGADESTAIKAPEGAKRCRIVDIHLSTAEIFACDATDAGVRIGTVADPDRYAQLNVPDATADATAFNIQDDTDMLTAAALNTANVAGDANPYGGVGVIDLTTEGITQLEVDFIDGTDGSAVTGQAYTTLVLAWW